MTKIQEFESKIDAMADYLYQNEGICKKDVVEVLETLYNLGKEAGEAAERKRILKLLKELDFEFMFGETNYGIWLKKEQKEARIIEKNL